MSIYKSPDTDSRSGSLSEARLTRKRLMRKLKIISGIVVALVVAWFIFASVNISRPPQGDVEARTDAVASLSPPPYRLPLAEDLFAQGHADHLLISYVPVDPRHFNAEWVAAWEPAEEHCEEKPEEENNISCFTPEEISTRGEAHAIREVAETESWDSITVVTSRHHVFRTRFIFEQCLGDAVDVNVVFPEPDLSLETTEGSWGWYLLYENVAFFKALYETTVRC